MFKLFVRDQCQTNIAAARDLRIFYHDFSDLLSGIFFRVRPPCSLRPDSGGSRWDAPALLTPHVGLGATNVHRCALGLLGIQPTYRLNGSFTEKIARKPGAKKQPTGTFDRLTCSISISIGEASYRETTQFVVDSFLNVDFILLLSTLGSAASRAWDASRILYYGAGHFGQASELMARGHQSRKFSGFGDVRLELSGSIADTMVDVNQLIRGSQVVVLIDSTEVSSAGLEQIYREERDGEQALHLISEALGHATPWFISGQKFLDHRHRWG